MKCFSPKVFSPKTLVWFNFEHRETAGRQFFTRNKTFYWKHSPPVRLEENFLKSAFLKQLSFHPLQRVFANHLWRPGFSLAIDNQFVKSRLVDPVPSYCCILLHISQSYIALANFRFSFIFNISCLQSSSWKTIGHVTWFMCFWRWYRHQSLSLIFRLWN